MDKTTFVLLLLGIYANCGTLGNNQAVYLAQINLNLPNLVFKFDDGNYIKL